MRPPVFESVHRTCTSKANEICGWRVEFVLDTLPAPNNALVVLKQFPFRPHLEPLIKGIDEALALWPGDSDQVTGKRAQHPFVARA